MYFQKGEWSIIYDKAIREDGSLFFPKRLNQEFLDKQRRELGSYIFFNQYLNEIIPAGEQAFKPEWLHYYDSLPELRETFAFIDPAISLDEKADYTALVVVHISKDDDWYVEIAKRQRLTATQTVNLFFQVNKLFKPRAIGVEIVAYQQALMHFLDSEMRRRGEIIPVIGLRRGPDKTKEMRIRALQPRFEWNRIFVKRGLEDFEDEYAKFPRSSHDDILDALSSVEEIVHPAHEKQEHDSVPAPNSSRYEAWYIRQLAQKAGQAQEEY